MKSQELIEMQRQVIFYGNINMYLTFVVAGFAIVWIEPGGRIPLVKYVLDKTHKDKT